MVSEPWLVVSAFNCWKRGGTEDQTESDDNRRELKMVVSFCDDSSKKSRPLLRFPASCPTFGCYRPLSAATMQRACRMVDDRWWRSGAGRMFKRKNSHGIFQENEGTTSTSQWV